MKNKGFTLIELLIVIAIIGILAAVVIVNVNSSRAGSRDARRVADIRQITTAMGLYFEDNHGYPTPDTPSATGPDPDSGDPRWDAYLLNWPVAPTPPDNEEGINTCDASTNQYTYTQVNDGYDFNVTFCLGSQVNNLDAGMHTLSSEGIQ